MTVYHWPATLPARAVAFNQRGMTVAGPPSLAGRTQVASLDAGFWVARLPLAAIGAGAQVNAFRAVRAKIEGGSHQILVPANDEGQAPWPLAGGAYANLNDDEPFSDGTLFSDGTGFFDPSILITIASAAAARATQISVTVTTAGTIAEGMLFSILDRLYVIRELLSATSWHIWPPLREAAPAGSDLNFDTPVCLMRLASEADMDLMLGRLWQAQPEIAFVEAAAA